MADDVDYNGLVRYLLSQSQPRTRDALIPPPRDPLDPVRGMGKAALEAAAKPITDTYKLTFDPRSLDAAPKKGNVAAGAKVGKLPDQDIGQREAVFDTLTNFLPMGKAAAGVGLLARLAKHDGTEAGRDALRFWQTTHDIPILPGDTRASTRFPTGKNRTEDPLQYHLSVGKKEMLDPETVSYNTGQLAKSPGFAHLKDMDPQEAAHAYTDQATKNLMAIYDASPQVLKERAPSWYEGAHDFSGALAERYGIPRQSASAATAVLSPQKDWFQNASLAERVGDTVFGAPKPWTSEMRGAAEARPAIMESDTNREMLRRITDKRFDQLEDPTEQALWLRLHDEAHNPRGYREINPEGTLGDFVKTKGGDQQQVAWGTFGDIDKAIRAYQSGGDMSVISPLLGSKHKVRSFYNNIEVPNDVRFGDVTGDTHQVAAAQMRPLAGGDPEVLHSLNSGFKLSDHPGFGGPQASSVTGVQGTYPFTTEPVRKMAEQVDMLPRAAQSVSWEGIRNLFPADWKTAKNKAAVDDIWRAVDRGELSDDQARRSIIDLAGGVDTPSWARPGAAAHDPRTTSTYR